MSTDDELVAEILDRYRAGGTVPAIARDCGVARSRVRGLVEAAGIARPRLTVSASSFPVSMLRAEYEAGASVPDIADTHDLDTTSLYTALRRDGTRMRSSGSVTQAAVFNANGDRFRPAVTLLREALRLLRTDRPHRTVGPAAIADAATELGVTVPTEPVIVNAFTGPYCPSRDTVRVIVHALRGEAARFDQLWQTAYAECRTISRRSICDLPGCDVIDVYLDGEKRSFWGNTTIHSAADHGPRVEFGFHACCPAHLYGALLTRLTTHGEGKII